MTALNELQNYTFISKYARWNEKEKRRETWKEAVDRVKGMMLERYADFDVENDINWAYDFMLKKKVLGSQRCLQFGGKPVLKHMARSYNCSASYCDRLRFFQECMYILLCGAGTGFSVQQKHIKKLPKFSYPRVFACTEKPKVCVVSDSIEGWADSIGVLLSSYFENPVFPEYYDCQVEFDYSEIRPQGSYLSSSAGKAPGPEPLKQAHIKIRELLDKCKEKRLRPIDAYDIICHMSDAVLAGGVRRSSCIALFSLSDKDMLNAKTGNWRQENPQRARCNNSVVLLRKDLTKDSLQEVVQRIKEYGEPGFFLVDDLETLCNPCCEIGFYAYDKKGKSGWGFCNLSTINAGSVKDEDDFYDRCKAAAIIGTLQAGFTDFPYLGKVTESIVESEALLGVSMTGIMEKPDITLDPNIQTKGAGIVKQTNKQIAKKIGINIAARCTAIKPEGSTSCVLGTSSGIHPHHAKRYLRRAQNNHIEAPFQFFKQHNPQATELSVWGASGTDENIIFPVEVPDGSKTKNQLPAVAMLEIVKSTQENWVKTGKRTEKCLKPWLTHNVSNTVFVQNGEWDEVVEFLFKNRGSFSGITFTSNNLDKDYPQPPFTAVYTSREIVREYGDAAIWCSGLIELALEAFDKDLWKACDWLLFEGELAPGEIPNGSSGCGFDACYFKTKAEKFAGRYFDGDVRRLTYCLKDVYNWKLYCDLRREMKPVDYTQMIEEEDNTKPEQELACSGGNCLI